MKRTIKNKQTKQIQKLVNSIIKKWLTLNESQQDDYFCGCGTLSFIEEQCSTKQLQLLNESQTLESLSIALATISQIRIDEVTND